MRPPPASLPGPTVRVAPAAPGVLPVLRIVLLGAAAVVTYVLLVAFDSAAASADDDTAGRRLDRGTPGITLARPGTPPPASDEPRADTLLSTATDLPRKGPIAGHETPERVEARPRGGAEGGPPSRGPAAARPAIPDVVDLVREIAGTVRSIRPAGPPDPAAPGTGGWDLARPGLGGLGLGRPAPEEPAPGGPVRGVVGVVPDAVGVVPEVVGLVPEVVRSVPAVIGALPDRAPDVVPPAIPGVIGTLPDLLLPILPVFPSTPVAPISLPWDAWTGTPPLGPCAAAPVAAGSVAGVPIPDYGGFVSRPLSAARSVPPSRDVGGGHSPPGAPPGNVPVTGAQQATGTGNGCSHPHAVAAASAVPAAYRLLSTAGAGDTDRTGCAPGVAAPPG